MNELKIILSLFKPYKYWLFLGGLLGLVTIFSAIGLMSLSGWFISAAAFAGLVPATAGQFNFLLPGAGVRFFAYLRIAGRYGERIVSHDATFRVLAHMRVWFYEKVEPLAPSHFMKKNSSHLLNSMVSDIDALDNLYIRVLMPTLIALLVCLIIFIFFYYFSHQLAWVIVFLMLTSLIFPALLFENLGRSAGKEILKSTEKLREKVIDTLEGLNDLLIFARMDEHKKSIGQANEALLRAQGKMALLSGLASGLMTFLLGITLWVGTFLAIGLYESHKIQGANIALIALCIIAAFEALAPLPLAFQYLGKTRAAAKRLLSVDNNVAVIAFPEISETPLTHYDIEFDQVDFSYGNEINGALRNVSLCIKSGEKIAVVGHTGAGKSTLINLLSRLCELQRGKISLGGIDIRNLTQIQLRSSITHIPQNPFIFNATIRENLLLARPDAGDKQLLKALKLAQLGQFIDMMPKGLDTWCGEFGAQLSGGQCRRMAIARAVLQDAPVLILDEPTEGLDQATARELMNIISEISINKTLIVITHNLGALKNIQRIITMNEGKIV